MDLNQLKEYFGQDTKSCPKTYNVVDKSLKTFIITLMACSFFLVIPFHGLAEKKNIDLKLKNELLSVNLDSVPLKEIIKKVEREMGIWFKGSESLLEEKVSVQFTNLSLDNGLKRILSSMSYSLIFNHNRQLEGVIIIAKKKHQPRALEEGIISKKKSGLTTNKKEQIGDKRPSKVTRNSFLSDNQIKATTGEIKAFKVIRNIPPPGGPVKPGQEEFDHFKVIRNLPPPDGPVKATGQELKNFKVIRSSPPPGS